jgi:putative membrane protein
MLKVMPITGALVAVLATAPGASAQVTSRSDSAVNNPWPQAGRVTTNGDVAADSTFIRQTIRGNYTEVALGRLAGSRATNSQVKDYAERMVSDYNDLNKEWVDLAQDNDMKVTVDFGPAGQQSIDRLEGLSGAAFDQAYMSERIREQEQDLAALQRMATSARSNELRQLSSTSASTVREHLALAQQVGSQVGVSSTAGRVGGVPTPAPTTTTDDHTRRTTTNDGNNTENRDDHGANNNESSSLGAADRAFVDNVLRDHLMHIRLAKQAQHQGGDEVKDLAQRIEKDFTKWSDRWENFADKRDAEVSSKLQPHNKEKLDRLNKAKDRKEFDRAYADLVADHLELMVQDFQAAGQRTQTPAVQRLAKDELPVIRDLHSRAQRLDREESSEKK